MKKKRKTIPGHSLGHPIITKFSVKCMNLKFVSFISSDNTTRFVGGLDSTAAAGV